MNNPLYFVMMISLYQQQYNDYVLNDLIHQPAI